MDDEKTIRTEIAEEVWQGISYRALDEKGEKEVRRALAKGEYGEPGTKCHLHVSLWLSSKDVERAEESLSISRKALSIANEANRTASQDLRWAKWAAIIAMTAAIAANKDQIFELISVLLN